MMTPQNIERVERLGALTPIDAIRAWLGGDFGIGDEPALIAAIHKDSRNTLSDDEIADVICEAMAEELDVEACLERLARPT
jgi:hypothetical protein